MANKMKGKLEPAERQKLIEEGNTSGMLCLQFKHLLHETNTHVVILHLGKTLKEKLASLEEDLIRLTDELQHEGQCIPNMTHPDVPIGDEDCSALRKMVVLIILF